VFYKIFFGTYTSRYSDFDGYWLFGFLWDLERLTIDLLNKESVLAEPTPMSVAILIARQKFPEQMAKASLPISALREACVEIVRLSEPAMGPVNGRTCAGRRFRFRVRALPEKGKGYESSKTIFVAPHNPEIAGRSARRPRS